MLLLPYLATTNDVEMLKEGHVDIKAVSKNFHEEEFQIYVTYISD